jgi:hypothetical protein
MVNAFAKGAGVRMATWNAVETGGIVKHRPVNRGLCYFKRRIGS